MIHGILNIEKEPGYTSHDVVAKLRGILKQKKIGHTGTLDPAASGVLPVCLGNATRLCDMLTEKSKEYEAVLLLGTTTDTQDTTGTVLCRRTVCVTEEEVTEAVLSFLGAYDQIPPMYSALKVDGRRLYELARAGKEVERKARRVTIEALEILEMDLPRVKIRVGCSKGTYIRSLCQDIGDKLGCGGTMEALVRTRSGNFVLADALKLSEVEALVKNTDTPEGTRPEEALAGYLVTPEAVFSAYPALHVTEAFGKLIDNGNPFLVQHTEEKRVETSPVRVYDGKGRFYGIYAYEEKAGEGRYRPVKMFLPE